MISKKIYNEIAMLRKENAKKSLFMFAMIYFKHYCILAFAQFQKDLIGYLEKIITKRGQRLAVAAPRGNAKSSLITLIYVLWCICFNFEPCILIFSSTKDQAEKLLLHIKDELSSNIELMNDFPEVCEKPNKRWRQDEIITKNNVNVKISSQGNNIRGLRSKADRPTLIILDDIESIEAVRSQNGREKICDWFSKVLLNLGSKKTNYIVVGTILHFDSLLAKLTSGEREKFPGFERRVYQSVITWTKRQELWDKWSGYYCGKELYDEKTGPDAAEQFFSKNSTLMLEGTEVLWPEKESYYDLMVIREEIGDFSFQSEKQNEPKDSGSLSLDINTIEWWTERFDSNDDLANFLGGNLFVMGSVDPAIKTGKRHDYSAIITAFVDRATKDIYIIDADIGKWNLDTLVTRICMHHQSRKYSSFFYEANAAQAWLGDTIRKEASNIPIKPVTNTKSKDGRIAKAILLIQRGKVKLSRKLTELNRQLSNYPFAAHDDAVDALATLVDMVDEMLSYDPQKMKEMFQQTQTLKSSNKILRVLDANGKFRQVDDPFGLYSV